MMRTNDKYLSLVKTELRNRTVIHAQTSLSLLNKGSHMGIARDTGPCDYISLR